MTDDEAPPVPLPPAAESPYPEQPAPHPERDEALRHLPQGPAVGALGVTLIGGAVAAAVGLLIAVPLIRRARTKPKARGRRKHGTK